MRRRSIKEDAMGTPRFATGQRESGQAALIQNVRKDMDALIKENARLKQLVVRLSKLVIKNAVERR
jgi:hypothetical protein